MEVLVYNSEKFHRTKRWYVLFVVVFAGVFFLTLFNTNYVGAVLLFFLLGGYFYYSAIHMQVVSLHIDDQGLRLGTIHHPWSFFSGYALEMYVKNNELKNIVLLTSSGHFIYTFADTTEHIRLFLMALDDYLPLSEEFSQTSFEKMIRKMQL